MLNIYYINLDNATERRVAIEENLQKFEALGIGINRIPAYDKKYIEDRLIGGAIRSTEKACFLSHIKAIEASISQPGHALILEDDILMGSESISQIKNILDLVKNSIDLLFVEMGITNLPSMFQLFRLKKELKHAGKIEILQTKLFDFAGATAYILNENSKIKLLEILRKIDSFDVPYDLLLKKLIIENNILSGCIFPFLATLSDQSLNTDIQLDGDSLPNIVWHSFRKLMFIEADYNRGNFLQDLQRIPPDFFGGDDLIFGKIISTAMSEKFPVRLF